MASSVVKDGGYWDSNTEMSARAFAVYVMDRLDGRSDYLVGHAESAFDMTVDKDGNPQIIYAFPRGDERDAINAAFDELVTQLKRERRLTHDERPESVIRRLKEAKPAGHEQQSANIPMKPRETGPAI
jgi:hypothetical protein